MPKVAWLTDIHLNFLSLRERVEFYNKIKESDATEIVITGDISDAPTTCLYLENMAKATDMPIYFVAGNHDYYNGAVDEMRERFYNLSHHGVIYLTSYGPWEGADNTVYVGVDGWADGVNGDYLNSNVVLNDSRFIKDLYTDLDKMWSYSVQAKAQLLVKMQRLANRDAKILIRQIRAAIRFKKAKSIIVLTHVPPFSENSKYKGGMANKDYLPFYTSAATGNVLMAYAKKYPDVDFLVLCGHSHHDATHQPLPNLLVRTGDAQYNHPQFKILDF